MRFRLLPQANLRVSEIGFDLSAMLSPAWKQLSSSQAERLLKVALDAGVVLFATADTYGAGANDDLLGRAFPKGQRDQIVIAAKVGYDIFRPGGGLFGLKGIPQNFEPAFIRYATEQALRRLRTDRIDLLQLHHPPAAAIHHDDLWQTLKRLQKEGKILHFGAALGPGLGWLYEGVDSIQQRQPAALEHVVNLLEPFPGNHLHAAAYAHLPTPEATVEDLPEFRHGRMEIEPQLPTRFFARFPHALGLLTGRLTRETIFAPNDPRAQLPRAWLLRGLEKVRQLEFLTGATTGRTLGQAALLWLLAEKTVASCLVPFESEAEIVEYATAPERNALEISELTRIDLLQGENFGVKDQTPDFEGTMDRQPQAQ